MKVKEARSIAQQWVDEFAVHLPGFHAAYLAGSIHRLPDDTPFPPYVDVDVHVVLDRAHERGQRQDIHLYHGLMVESYFIDRSAVQTWEQVVSDPLESPAFRWPCVLADPTGELTAIQQKVAEHFTERKWVEARCTNLRNQIVGTLASDALSSSMPHMVKLLGSIPHLIAIAHVKNPTNRRALCQIREILRADDREDLYESILALHGLTDFTREDTEIRLAECVRAFNRAVEVFRTPFWSDHRMHAYVLPYIEDGAREMMDEGCHREALGWIVWNHLVANFAIQNDAPEEEKREFQEAYDRLYAGSNTWYGNRAWPTPADTARIRTVVDEVLHYVCGVR